MKTQLIKLAGGGSVLYAPVKGIQGVHIYLDFAAGSVNDPKGKLGLAHFCEHILCGFDTANIKKEEKLSRMRSFQLYNASTGRENMQFFVHTVKNHFMQALDLLTDPFANVIIDEKEFERERKVILDEVATNLKLNWKEAAYLYNKMLVKEPHLNNQTASPAGDAQTVGNITIKDVRGFMDKYFTQNNLIVTIVGNVSKKEVLQGIKKYILPRIKEKGEKGFMGRTLQKDIMTPPKMVSACCAEKGKAYIEFGYKLDFKPFTGRLEDGDYCRNILTQYLREKMFEKLRLDSGLCYACESVVKRSHRVRRLEDIIECAEENLDRVIEKYLAHIRQLPADMEKSQFEKFKQRICERENYDVDTLQHIASGVFEAYDLFGLLNYQKLKKYNMQRFSSITYEEVNALYKSLFKNPPYIIIVADGEKYKTKEFEKDLYKKIKTATKRA